MLKRRINKDTNTKLLLSNFDESDEDQLQLTVGTIFMRMDDYIHNCALSLIIEHGYNNHNKKQYSKIHFADLKDFDVIHRIDIADIKELNQFNYFSVPRISMPIYHFLYINKPKFIEFFKEYDEAYRKYDEEHENNNTENEYEFDYDYDDFEFIRQYNFKHPIEIQGQSSSDSYGRTLPYLITGFILESF